jgi:signal transduction histidine kinase
MTDAASDVMGEAMPGVGIGWRWLGASLKRKVALALGATLTLASLCFLAILVWSYRERVLEERGIASAQLNQLLQVGLENAMLKRDIPGLRQIVTDLGRQERIAGVMILSPDGEVRFASQPELVGRRYDVAKGELCPDCRASKPGEATSSALLANGQGGDVVRSVNAVRNKEPCTQCHGAVGGHPVNGILVVDYDASQIAADTMKATLALSGAGLVVLLGSIGGIGWVLSRTVLAPVARLTLATEGLSAGAPGPAVRFEGNDEIARLGRAFDRMAGRIAADMREIGSRERFLQALIDAIPDGVRVLAEDYTVVKTNAAFAAQQGLDPAAIVGKPCYVSSHGRTEPCAPTLVTCPLHEIGKGKSALTCRAHHVSGTGADIPVEISAAPLVLDTGSGRQRLVIEVIRDLGHEMRISQEQRLSAIGLLAAGVAHEIRNPLTSVHLGFASINREISEGRVANVAEYLKLIEAEIERCIDVTSRLLKLSAPAESLPELVTVSVAVTEVLSLLRAEAQKGGVEVVIDVPSSLRIIASDGELRMVVFNLSQNALHAMPKGGRLEVRGALVGANVQLTFSDTGVGIAADDLQRIFDPFWSRRADNVQGTGLGLSICREIVKHHKGTIEVRSTLGAGTRFIVTLPSADAEGEVA